MVNTGLVLCKNQGLRFERVRVGGASGNVVEWLRKVLFKVTSWLGFGMRDRPN